MEYLIEISYRPGFTDALGNTVHKNIRDLDISGVNSVKTSQLYLIEGTASEQDLETLCEELLADKITQQYTISPQSTVDGLRLNDKRYAISDKRGFVVEVWYKKGVTDAVADTVKKGASDLGIKGIDLVKTGFGYIISGRISRGQVEKICKGLLSNKVVQEYKIQ